MKKISFIVLIVAILISSVSTVSFAHEPAAGEPPQEYMGHGPQNPSMDHPMQEPVRPHSNHGFHPEPNQGNHHHPGHQAPLPAPAPKPEAHHHHDSSVVKLIAALLLLDAVK